MSSNRRARFRSMFIWTRSSWRSPSLPEPPPPTLPLPAPTHAPIPSTDPESSASASFSGDLVIALPPLPPPCRQMLASGNGHVVLCPCGRAASIGAVCVPEALSRCRAFISVRINCCVLFGRVDPGLYEVDEFQVRIHGLVGGMVKAGGPE